MVEGKTHLNLTADAGLVQKAKHAGLNLSGEFERFLQKRFEVKIEIQDPQIINPEIEKKKAEMIQLCREFVQAFRVEILTQYKCILTKGEEHHGHNFNHSQ